VLLSLLVLHPPLTCQCSHFAPDEIEPPALGCAAHTRRETCMGLGYFWIRFGRGSSSYLSTAQGMSRPVYLQSTWMRSRRGALETGAPIWHQYVADLVEEMTLCK
jgi:hypothetical protein